MNRSECEQLLYRAIRELEYVQNAGMACDSGMCATPVGKEIVRNGMRVLGITSLAEEQL